MEYKRKQFEVIMNRINEPRGRMQVIVGPRQVGKHSLHVVSSKKKPAIELNFVNGG